MVRLRQTLDWFAWTSLVCWFGEQWRASAEPRVLSPPPAGDFFGPDGQWTAFTFSIGTPPQQMNFLPSTSSSQFLLPVAAGCPNNVPECPTDRGNLYDRSASSSWEASEPSSGNITLLQNLNISVQANFGTETVAFDDVSVQRQTVSEISQYAYYVGVAGLHIWDDISSAGNTDQTDYISSLRDSGAIPSLTYGYTAGARYRLKGVPGSLTLGGYDQSRFDSSKQIVVDFNGSSTRDLAIRISQISTNYNGSDNQLLPDPVQVLIDTSTSDLWLPQAACQQFEDVFRLRWNATNQLYSINSADHDELSTANPNITFTLVNPSDDSSTDFVLPYSAFDQTASFPRFPNYPDTTNYFPLRRANNSNQYTLGRVFFQETYLFVNFENGTFSLAPAVFSDSNPPSLVAMYQNGTTAGASGDGAVGGDSGNSSGGGSTNSVAIGAGVGVPVGVLLIAGIGAFFWWRRRKSKRAGAPSEKSHFDTNTTTPSSGVAMKKDKALGGRGVGNGDEMNTGIDHEVYEVGSSNGPPKGGPADPLELDGSGAPGLAGTKLTRGASSDDTNAATGGGRRAELGTSYTGAELASNYSGAELGSHYSGAELQGSPIMNAVEIASIPSPSLSATALRSGTVSPMTATSPGPGSPHMRALHSSQGVHGHLGVPRSAPSPGSGDETTASHSPPTRTTRPNLLRNPSSTEPI